jgi:hypothetical protein
MKSFAFTLLASALLVTAATSATACGGTVGSPRDTGEAAEPPGSAAASSDSPRSERQGLPCSYLHGQANLTSRRGYDDYASSSFSFEYASQDADVTRNEFDLQYAGDIFIVNMIVDDASFIVDLGDVPLRDVPRTVDPADYPVGQWGEHDAIQAQADHTYFVRSIDGAGRLVAAFRVLQLEPGRRVQIEWIRSTDTDAMVHPLACLG